jgi:hypothetical protein
MSSDPSIKVIIQMPASVYNRLRQRAFATGSSMSRICREGALRALAEAQEADSAGRDPA